MTRLLMYLYWTVALILVIPILLLVIPFTLLED